MKIFHEKLNEDMIKMGEFKEDSVREEIIAPILKALGYSAFGENRIIRSKNLTHPYVYFGTKKEKINIIPDYLLQVGGINSFIIDAKKPKENIIQGKNVEQAYSYAIHRNIRTDIYVLCNGIDFNVFHVNKTYPIYHIKTIEIEKNWHELYRVLSPFAMSKKLNK